MSLKSYIQIQMELTTKLEMWINPNAVLELCERGYSEESIEKVFRGLKEVREKKESK